MKFKSDRGSFPRTSKAKRRQRIAQHKRDILQQQRLGQVIGQSFWVSSKKVAW